VKDGSEGALDLRALRSSGAFDLALQAGIASNPPRLLDPLFHQSKGLHLREALEASGTTRAREVEAEHIDGMLGTHDIHHLVALEANPGPGHWLGRFRGSLGRVTLVSPEPGLLQLGLAGIPGQVPCAGILADLREGVRHLKLEVQGPRTIAWAEGALSQYPPEVAMHLLRHVGACLGAEDLLILGGECAEGVKVEGRLPATCGDPVREWADAVLRSIPGFPERGWSVGWKTSHGVDHLEARREDGADFSFELGPNGVFPGGKGLELARIHRWSAADLDGAATHAGLRVECSEMEGGYRVAILRR
jgi:hypothetical protein